LSETIGALIEGLIDANTDRMKTDLTPDGKVSSSPGTGIAFRHPKGPASAWKVSTWGGDQNQGDRKMDRTQKEEMVELLKGIFDDSGSVVLAEYSGMTVAEKPSR